MSREHELTTYNVPESNDALVVSQHLGELLSLGEALVKSGLAPKEVRTAEAAAAIVLKGRELNLPPMHSLSHIVLINGKPTLSAEVMLAMLLRAGHEVWFSETSAQRATIHGVRKGSTREQSLTWTIEEAQAAGLVGNQNWRKYPSAMLRARATSAFARFFAPDVVMGAYSPEELGAEVNSRGEYVGMLDEAEQPTARGAVGLAGRLKAAQTIDTPTEEEAVDAEFSPVEDVALITASQAKALSIALKSAGFKTDEESKAQGRAFVSWLASLEQSVESIKDLTAATAAAALDRIGSGENGSYRTDDQKLAEALTAWHEHLDLQRGSAGGEPAELPLFDPNEKPGKAAKVADMEPITDEKVPF